MLFSSFPDCSCRHGPVGRPPPTLHILAVDPWSALGGSIAQLAVFASIIVDVFKVEGVDMAGEISGTLMSTERRGSSAVGNENTYPSSVRQIFMRKSAPQPAIRKTPTGGTKGGRLVRSGCDGGGVGCLVKMGHTENGDYDQKDGRNRVDSGHGKIVVRQQKVLEEDVVNKMVIIIFQYSRSQVRSAAIVCQYPHIQTIVRYTLA